QDVFPVRPPPENVEVPEPWPSVSLEARGMLVTKIHVAVGDPSLLERAVSARDVVKSVYLSHKTILQGALPGVRILVQVRIHKPIHGHERARGEVVELVELLHKQHEIGRAHV